MARDVATVQTVDNADGLGITFSAFTAANGGQYDNTAQSAFMVFRTTDASPKTITVSTTKTISPQEVTMPSKTFTLPASSGGFIIPVLTNQWWGQPSSVNNILVDISDDTGVTWAVVTFE